MYNPIETAREHVANIKALEERMHQEDNPTERKFLKFKLDDAKTALRWWAVECDGVESLLSEIDKLKAVPSTI